MSLDNSFIGDPVSSSHDISSPPIPLNNGFVFPSHEGNFHHQQIHHEPDHHEPEVHLPPPSFTPDSNRVSGNAGSRVNHPRKEHLLIFALKNSLQINLYSKRLSF